MTIEHVPVMLKEVVEFLRLIRKDEPCRYMVDATLGLGGYSEALLKAFPDMARLYGIDQDRQAIEKATARLAPFGDRFKALEGNFSSMKDLMNRTSVNLVDAVVFDLGVSNMQITLAERGFSFRNNGPLDMRMDSGTSGGQSAYDVVNSMDPQELCNIFKEYGEEKFAWKIAKAIERYRDNTGPIEDTDCLVAIIRDVLPAPVMRKSKGHPARKVFQALRIYVNDEMSVLNNGLDQAFEVLSPGGVMVVVDYHSLEDRMVKWRFRKWQDDDLGEIITRKALPPREEEVELNPKSRSAKLRVFVKKSSLSDKSGFLALSYRERKEAIKKIISS